MKYNPIIVCAWFKQNGLPRPALEHRFHPVRLWRFDFAWPDSKIALEVEGALWTNGGHSRGSGRIKDHEKFNHAAALGWRILYCQPKEICTMELIDLLHRAFLSPLTRKVSDE